LIREDHLTDIIRSYCALELFDGQDEAVKAAGITAGICKYPGPDCQNGALIHVANGNSLMEAFYSHHNLILTGHRGVELKYLARALGLEFDAV
jgi:hypothetical protein